MVAVSEQCLRCGKMSVSEALGGQSRSRRLFFAHRFVLGELAGAPKGARRSGERSSRGTSHGRLRGFDPSLKVFSLQMPTKRRFAFFTKCSLRFSAL